MNLLVRLLLYSVVVIETRHFNGGTIRWEPVDPYDTTSPVTITIIQTYSWTYPVITCAVDVPITTSGRSGANKNLICIADCSTDGGYSAQPINILTDCVSVNNALGMMTSSRAVNVSLSTGAHFYVSYMDSAWVALNDPAVSGHQWSITSLIDLRLRPDGFINTPPVASVVSPQYAIVNRTTQIKIPVSDANAGDDVRCRWSTYTPGVNRRRRASEEGVKYNPVTYRHNDVATEEKHSRMKRGKGNSGTTKDPCSNCYSYCWNGCPCTCSKCVGTNCPGNTCKAAKGSNSCPITTTVAGATLPATTSETPGTLATTISYYQRQAIDECGGICYPSSVPTGTTLSDCTISFTGLKAGAWYGISVQVSKDLGNIVSKTGIYYQSL